MRTWQAGCFPGDNEATSSLGNSDFATIEKSCRHRPLVDPSNTSFLQDLVSTDGNLGEVFFGFSACVGRTVSPPRPCREANPPKKHKTLPCEGSNQNSQVAGQKIRKDKDKQTSQRLDVCKEHHKDVSLCSDRKTWNGGDGRNYLPCYTIENAPKCYRTPRCRDPEFPRKNTEKIHPGPNCWTPRIYPPKYPENTEKRHQNTKNAPFRYFLMFSGYFRGIFLGFRNFGLGGIFSVFSWKFRVGLSWGSVAGRDVLNYTKGKSKGINVHFRTCTLFFVIFGARDCPLSVSQRESNREEGGRKKAWKGGVRRLRPKFWQRTKCTFEKRTFVPS